GGGWARPRERRRLRGAEAAGAADDIWAGRHGDDKEYQTTRHHSVEDPPGDTPSSWFSSAPVAAAASLPGSDSDVESASAEDGASAEDFASAVVAVPAASTESGGPASRCADRLGRRRGAFSVAAAWSFRPASETLAVPAATGAAAPSAAAALLATAPALS